MTDVEGVTAEPTAPSTDTTDVKDTAQPAVLPEQTPEQRIEAAEKAKAALELRIKRQTAANRDAQRRYEEAQAKLKEYESKKPESGAPKQDDFDNYEDFVKAQAKYEAKQEFEAERAKETQAKQREAEARQAQEYLGKFEKLAAEMRETSPDFDEKFEVVSEVVSTVPDGMGKQAFQYFMREAENPAEVVYHLGAQPELLEKLQGMSPVGIIKELALLEHGLKGKPKSKADPKAPPITPVKGNGKTAKPLVERSAEEVLEWARKR